MSLRRIDNAAVGGGASITIAPYEYPLVWEFVGRGRYMQAAFCKSVAQLYSAKFGKRTAKNLSNIAAEGAFVGLLEWSKDIGCCWNESVFESGASGGSVDILDWLLDKGCPISKDAAACTAAAAGGHVEALKFLSLCGCHADRNTFTAAAEYGHLNVLQFAHKFRFDWDVESAGRSAAFHGYMPILLWMHETLHIDGLFDENTCESASSGGKVEVLQWLRSVDCAWDGRTCWEAISNAHVDVLRWAIEEGCPWSVEDKTIELGDTALHVAADNGSAQILEYLISIGSNLNALEDTGCTPLFLAICEGSLDCVKMLLTAGADVTIADREGTTPLGLAIRHSHQKIIELLRAAGARE